MSNFTYFEISGQFLRTMWVEFTVNLVCNWACISVSRFDVICFKYGWYIRLGLEESQRDFLRDKQMPT